MKHFRKFVYKFLPAKLAYGLYSHMLRDRADTSDYTQADLSDARAIDRGEGRLFFVFPSDEKGRRYLSRLDLETKLHSAWAKVAKTYDLFVDAGSNYGEYILCLAESGVRSDATVVVYEPNKKILSAFRKSLTTFKMPCPVIIRECGASDQNGVSKFYVNKSDSGASSRALSYSVNPAKGIFLKRESIVLERPDDFIFSKISEETALAIKIDTEGHDFFALRGLEKSILKCGKFYIALESGRQQFVNGLKSMPVELSDRLFENGIFVYYNNCFYKCADKSEVLSHYGSVANNLDIVFTNDNMICKYMDIISD